MSVASAFPAYPQHDRITYLSPALPVNMGDWWFEIASLDHFWVRRRFEVLKRFAGVFLENAQQIGEIGCGHGLLQREIEDYYGVQVDGFELNEYALNKNVSQKSSLYCYDIHQKSPAFRTHFDLLLLFDVLEHIENEQEFLQSAKFHMKQSGILLINVPAHQALYSNYDRAAGHVRRYDAKQITNIAKRGGFKVRAITYWGFPLIPLLVIRKLISSNPNNGKTGFQVQNRTVNAGLSFLARCESIPQRFVGTSLMAILQNCD